MQTISIRKWFQFSTFSLFPQIFKCICLFYNDFNSNSFGKFIPDHPIFELLHQASRCHTIDLRTIHAHTITSNLIKDNFVSSRIVEFFFTNANNPHYAIAVFDSIDSPDVYTWNLMIKNSVSVDSAISFYFRMIEKCMPPNNYTFSLLVKACCIFDCRIEMGRMVHGQILKNGIEDFLVVRNSLMKMYCQMNFVEDGKLLFDTSIELDMISWNSMISAYGDVGDVNSARNLFDEMPIRNLVSWGAMVDCYVENGFFKEGLDVFYEMQMLGVKADIITLVSALKACANLGAFDQGRWIHMYIVRNKMNTDTNLVLSTSLIDMYAKCGCIDIALKLFNGIREKDIVVWNSIICGLGLHGFAREALEILERMETNRISPNATTFIGILCACTHGGMLHDGVRVFNSMKEVYGIEPQSEHYGCLADLLGRAGLVREAENVLKSMPVEPQASHLGALMAACRTHNNIEVAERVGKRLISLDPYDGGRYILLLNIYAASGRWEEVTKMRRLMEEKEVKKEIGCSFIELNGAVHEFVVGSNYHPQYTEIHEMLRYIERGLKFVGSVEEISNT